MPASAMRPPAILKLQRTKSSVNAAVSKLSKERTPAILALKRGDASAIRSIIHSLQKGPASGYFVSPRTRRALARESSFISGNTKTVPGKSRGSSATPTTQRRSNVVSNSCMSQNPTCADSAFVADSTCPVHSALIRWALTIWVSVCHRGGELNHSARDVCRERSLHLRKVYFDLVAVQDDSLREPGSSIGESHKSPLKRQCRTVQTHLARGCVGRSDLSEEPV